MKVILGTVLKYKLFIIALGLAVIAVFPLFQYGLPPTHDGEYHVVRFYEFDKTLRSGSLYPVWADSLNFELGVPLFNYVYPLPNYMASLFHMLGFSFIDAFKLNLIITTILGAVTSFFLGRQKFGNWGGLLTSVFYTYAPYHFLDIYIRGSVGEVWALAFFPLPVIFINKIIKRPQILDSLLLGLSLSLIIFSHNILSLMYCFFIGTYVVFIVLQRKERMRKFLYIFFGGILSLLLSAVFVVPALLEQKYVEGLNTFSYKDHFPEIYQLLIPSWGAGYSGISSGTQMSFQVGFVNILIVLFLIGTLLSGKIKKERAYVLFFLVWFFVLFYLLTSYSVVIWDFIFPMSYFQFPWRLLSLVIFCCAVLAGSITLIIKSKIFYALVLFFLLITTYTYAKPPYMLERTDGYYMKNSSYIYGTNSIGNAFQTKWLPLQDSVATIPGEFKNGSGNIVNIFSNSTYKSYEIDFPMRGGLILNTAYFPGWRGYADGKKIEVLNEGGRIGLNLSGGEELIELRFGDTPVRLASKLISAITLGIILIFILKYTVIQWIYGYRNR